MNYKDVEIFTATGVGMRINQEEEEDKINTFTYSNANVNVNNKEIIENEFINSNDTPNIIIHLVVFEIVNDLQFSIQCESNNKIEEQILNSNSIIDNYFKENTELKKLNEILEREINLLKSLILINNLNLNTSETKPLYHENYFIEMCNDENLKQVINDDRLYKQQEILHIMQLKINNMKERLDLFKKGFEEDRRSYIDYMDVIHKRIMDYFNHEIKIRKTIEEKVSNIKKLI